VALSRATARSNIRILAVPAVENNMNKGKEKHKEKNKATKHIFTNNIVYKKVLKEVIHHTSIHIFQDIRGRLTLKINKNFFAGYL